MTKNNNKKTSLSKDSSDQTGEISSHTTQSQPFSKLSSTSPSEILSAKPTSNNVQPKDTTKSISTSKCNVATENDEQENDSLNSSTPTTIRFVRRKGPSLFSLYFLVPCVVVTLLNVSFDRWWHEVYLVNYYSKAGAYNLAVPLHYEAYLAWQVWSSLVFVFTVLHCARGRVVLGFVYGGFISSALNVNWFPLGYCFLNKFNFDLTHMDFVLHVGKGALFGQVSVVLAAMFLPKTRSSLSSEQSTQMKKMKKDN